MAAGILITYEQMARIAAMSGEYSKLSPFGLLRDVVPSRDEALFFLGILDRKSGKFASEFAQDLDILVNPDLFTSVAIGEGAEGAVLSFYTDTRKDRLRPVGLHMRSDEGFILQTGVDREHMIGWVDSFAHSPAGSRVSPPPFCDMTMTGETVLVFFSLIDQLISKLSSADDLDFTRDEMAGTVATGLEGDLDTFAGLVYTLAFRRDRRLNQAAESPQPLADLAAAGIVCEGEEPGTLGLTDEWLKGFLGMSLARPRYFSIHADRIVNGCFCSGSMLAIEAAGAFIFVEPGVNLTDKVRLTIAGKALLDTLFKGILNHPEKWLDPRVPVASESGSGDTR